MITDIQLPHVGGLELIRLLQADAELRAVPIMAVTAYAGAGRRGADPRGGRQSLCVQADFGGAVRGAVDELLAEKRSKLGAKGAALPGDRARSTMRNPGERRW